MTFLDLLETIKQQINKYPRHCLWRGSNMEDKIPTLVAWSTVCRPKKQGGLGIFSINAQNNAFLIKNTQFFNTHDIPWVNMVWEAYYVIGQLPGNHMVGSFWWKANVGLLD